MVGTALSTGLYANTFLPRNIPSRKEKQSEEDKQTYLTKAQAKRDRKKKLKETK